MYETVNTRFQIFFIRFKRFMKLRKMLATDGEMIPKRKVDSIEVSNTKRLKTSSEDVVVECSAAKETKTRLKYNKYAMYVSYCGKNYFGMQINLDIPTIERDIFAALRKVDLIDDEDVIKPGQKMNFQRAARTDKNVSAVKQMCSVKLPRTIEEDIPNVVGRLKEALPTAVRIWGFTRATKHFCSKRSCDNRTYSYTCPSFAFAKEGEALDETFRLSADRLNELNSLLISFKGTHNFFNYTSQRKFEDRSCKRFIISSECGDPFIRNDVEFVTIKIRGQSFMLHQIRKMIGICIAVIRGIVDKSFIETSFSSEERLDVPRAPGLGLVLEEVHYDCYNKRYEKTHEKILWDKYQDELNEFRKTYIDAVIIETETTEKSMLQWLETVINHNFHSTVDESAAKEESDDDGSKSPNDISEQSKGERDKVETEQIRQIDMSAS